MNSADFPSASLTLPIPSHLPTRNANAESSSGACAFHPLQVRLTGNVDTEGRERVLERPDNTLSGVRQRAIPIKEDAASRVVMFFRLRDQSVNTVSLRP